MTTYMRRFGFYSWPWLNSAADLISASGVHLGGALVLPTSDRGNLGQLAVGQGNLTATTLQMAMVAAAVADGGKLMDPHVQTIAPTLQAQVMRPATAGALNQMMRAVVTAGTGTPAAVAGLQIAGKTATVHVGGPHSHRSELWFIGFAPANAPRIAVAVVLSNAKRGYGGTEAGPIAASVIQTLLATRQ